jgi:hypothetical protein
MRLISALALLAIATRALAQDSTATPHLPVGFAAPERVGRYTRGRAYDYGSSEGGVSYQYGDSVTRLTTYFYARDSVLRGRSAREAVVGEVERFKQVLEIERARGAYDEYVVAFDTPDSIPVPSNTGTPTFAPGSSVAGKRPRAGAIALFRAGRSCRSFGAPSTSA